MEYEDLSAVAAGIGAVEKMRKRAEAAEAEVAIAKQNALDILAMKQASDDQVERLEAEVERLRAALVSIRTALRETRAHEFDSGTCLICMACCTADAALEAK